MNICPQLKSYGQLIAIRNREFSFLRVWPLKGVTSASDFHIKLIGLIVLKNKMKYRILRGDETGVILAGYAGVYIT